MSESTGFNQLNKGVQRWVWSQNWSELRDIQEQSIEPILEANCDVIISASTAAGKTEAAFLPVLSKLADNPVNGFGVLYISPLKALINDQYRRLQSLGEQLDIPITPWHGDISLSVKQKRRNDPQGVLLITPESLESMLLNQSGWVTKAFPYISHIIIDEFHAFIGTERGRQLQSLMQRLEFILNRVIPRVALSATLGDMQLIGESLRQSEKLPCKIIESNSSHSDLKIQLRGYIEKAVPAANEPIALEEIISDLYALLRGKSHLVFANSRSRTEEVAAKLSDLCDINTVPNEFFPHHGNLSKELRESLESRLQENKWPTTAVCTMTLELGIDIGNVDSIAQITAPHSVASLRQRLGRSGRRGDAAILRLFILEDEVTSHSSVHDRLRLQVTQCVAMINLLLNKWYEPASAQEYHLSTLVQQTLSVIGQYGGVRADQLWKLLCDTGPFKKVDQTFYADILRALGKEDLITQMQDGQITLGKIGERVVGHYSFYTAFSTPEEYRLECKGRTLGTIPIDNPITIGEHIIFAGQRWEVLDVDPEKKFISLKHAKGGVPPKFDGGGLSIHDMVRKEMRSIYLNKSVPPYLDEKARDLFNEAMDSFESLGLEHNNFIQQGKTLYLYPWLGDRTVNTIAALLRMSSLKASTYAGIIDIENCTVDEYRNIVINMIASEKPTNNQLANNVPDTIIEKFDIYLPKNIRDVGYGEKNFNVEDAWSWLKGAL
ncbi:MAG: DEAD/DEAH box helicase [Woeseiaceae bacterium]